MDSGSVTCGRHGKASKLYRRHLHIRKLRRRTIYRLTTTGYMALTTYEHLHMHIEQTAYYLAALSLRPRKSILGGHHWQTICQLSHARSFHCGHELYEENGGVTGARRARRFTGVSREVHGRFTERIGGEENFYFFEPFSRRIYTSLHLDEIPLFHSIIGPMAYLHYT